MNEKERFLQTWEREFQITLKVLRAYPSDQLNLQPHERSRSAKELAWTFVVDQGLVNKIVSLQTLDFKSMPPPPPPPATMKEIVAAYESTHDEMAKKFRNFSEADFNKTIRFPVGPGQMGDLRRAEALWMTMMDQVHHRGQFSVYLRLAGGKVPSIYGPTADEPWT
ncbi:MAG: hypothetical protein ALAOOOJD_01766 [bacterium]|nr:hypothetical protein [bacterium]